MDALYTYIVMYYNISYFVFYNLNSYSAGRPQSVKLTGYLFFYRQQSLL